MDYLVPADLIICMPTAPRKRPGGVDVVFPRQVTLTATTPVANVASSCGNCRDHKIQVERHEPPVSEVCEIDGTTGDCPRCDQPAEEVGGDEPSVDQVPGLEGPGVGEPLRRKNIPWIVN